MRNEGYVKLGIKIFGIDCGRPDEMVETRVRTSYSTDSEALSEFDVFDEHDIGVKMKGKEDDDPFLEKFYKFLQS